MKKKLKRWDRGVENELIEKFNPLWEDLFNDDFYYRITIANRVGNDVMMKVVMEKNYKCGN